ncbi:SlyX family protein [Thiomicrorhabdus xiamenensis]|uniref:SlyX family protein n=1 Tax=Thiomicrorhabdus xiamenensis TaxID=2739063 RepID=A0A7D4P4E1_9GAMM|nr:SlyX family protein [Thiomicrorhabdus xiamenensis]QKI89176.1 SlyX family protein [Thiomicrorhabdus xiamenensis]
MCNQNSEKTASDAQLVQRIETLEIAISHHEQMHVEMEKTLADQYTKIQMLEKKLGLLKDYIQSLNEQVIKRPEEEIPPPHY